MVQAVMMGRIMIKLNILLTWTLQVIPAAATE